MADNDFAEFKSALIVGAGTGLSAVAGARADARRIEGHAGVAHHR